MYWWCLLEWWLWWVLVRLFSRWMWRSLLLRSLRLLCWLCWNGLLLFLIYWLLFRKCNGCWMWWRLLCVWWSIFLNRFNCNRIYSVFRMRWWILPWLGFYWDWVFLYFWMWNYWLILGTYCWNVLLWLCYYWYGLS